jgi:hypothetical protein
MPNGPSRARLGFDEIFSYSDPFMFLNSIISGTDRNLTSSWQESEWLDYKDGAFYNPAILGKGTDPEAAKNAEGALKSIWSENLASFANTSGGVLIFGIKTKNREPHRFSLSSNAAYFADRLREIQNNAIDPPLTGVEVREILDPTGGLAGLVVCYIPASQFSPYRAQWAEREFYFRVGDSNRVIPTAMLRRMFYPVSSPRIIPTVAAKMAKADHGGMSIHMRVDITNQGTASAEEICVEVVGPYIPFPAQEHWKSRHLAKNILDCNITIHPGQRIKFLYNLTNNNRYAEWPPEGSLAPLKFRVFARNMRPIHCEFSFSVAELRDAQDSNKEIVRDGLPVDISF